ncbi:MAG TPA: LLM class F420-dependent oxidoreductase [Acidimicrobiales bacterium]|nr:LLM class F420-dependent oxidoreductase [Acidimicrobiales bacterium]
MRIGTMVSSNSIDDAIKQVADLKRRGLSSAWLAQIFGLDALTAITVIGREVPGIELGTAVVPTYPRHPQALAMQALTVQAAIGNRLALGIGLSHQLVIEGMYGMSFDKPARHMREYLSILKPLLNGENVAFDGEGLTWRGMGPLDIAGAEPPTLLLAALAPRMLELAGAVADGTVTWMTGPGTVGDHIVPSITKAAESAGRPAPRIGVGLPVSVTANPDAAREQASNVFAIYGQLPSYRAMLDREGAAGPADVAIVGDEGTVVKEIQRVMDAGATDFVAAVFGSAEEQARTLDVLTENSYAAKRATSG